MQINGSNRLISENLNTNKPSANAKEKNTWNGRSIAIVAVGTVALIALSVLLYRSTVTVSSPNIDEVVSSHYIDLYCNEDAPELHKFGASSFSMGWLSENTPACITSVLGPFCKQAIEKMCSEKDDRCSNVEVTGVYLEHDRDLLCYAEVSSEHCDDTFKPVDSTNWTWLDVTDFKGWEKNPILKWAMSIQGDESPLSKIVFKTQMTCNQSEG